MQDCEEVLGGLQALEECLALIRCGPKVSDEHNITNVHLPTFTRSLVGVVKHSTRIMAGLGFLHHPDPVIHEPDLQEVLDFAGARAECTSVTFELNGAPSIKAEEWPTYPAVGEMNVKPRLIKGKRPLKELNKAIKVAGSRRLRRKRPPPRFCASYPPVANSDMLIKRETLKGWLIFMMIPDLWNEKVPESLRWRHFALLTGIPHFPRSASQGGFYRRYFRWVTSFYVLLTFIPI